MKERMEGWKQGKKDWRKEEKGRHKQKERRGRLMKGIKKKKTEGGVGEREMMEGFMEVWKGRRREDWRRKRKEGTRKRKMRKDKDKVEENSRKSRR